MCRSKLEEDKKKLFILYFPSAWQCPATSWEAWYSGCFRRLIEEYVCVCVTALWSVWVSSPGCVPAKPLAQPQPTALGKFNCSPARPIQRHSAIFAPFTSVSFLMF